MRDMVYCKTGYDIIIYFRSEVIAKKTVQNTASDGFGWERLENGLSKNHESSHTSRTIGVTNLPDRMSLAAAG